MKPESPTPRLTFRAPPPTPPLPGTGPPPLLPGRPLDSGQAPTPARPGRARPSIDFQGAPHPRLATFGRSPAPCPLSRRSDVAAGGWWGGGRYKGPQAARAEPRDVARPLQRPQFQVRGGPHSPANPAGAWGLRVGSGRGDPLDSECVILFLSCAQRWKLRQRPREVAAGSWKSMWGAGGCASRLDGVSFCSVELEKRTYPANQGSRSGDPQVAGLRVKRG